MLYIFIYHLCLFLRLLPKYHHTTHWVFFFICTAFIAWTKILPKVAWTLIFWCIPYWFIYYPKKIQGLTFDFTFFSCFGCWCTSYGSIHGWWMFVGHAWCWKPRLHHEGVHALRWLCQSLCWKAQLARYDIKFQSSVRLTSNRKLFEKLVWFLEIKFLMQLPVYFRSDSYPYWAHWGKNPQFIRKFTFWKSQFSLNSHRY